MSDQNQEQKPNPWSESDSVDADGAKIKAEAAQLVTKLPTILAEDLILQNLLQTSDQAENLDKYGNDIVPLRVNYGGKKAQEISGKKFAVADAHKDKQVIYDPEKGLVSTNSAYFELDPSQQPNTSDPNGIFVKHLATAVITPQQMKGAHKLNKIQMQSLAFTSANLGSNAWSNVLLYKPKEQVFEYDPKQNKMTQKKDQEP